MSAHDGRLTSEDRREQILAAASIVFGERGYSGGTTDAVARAAGISQAYVVRMFGSKENLFREVCERAGARVATAFREAIAELPADATAFDKQSAMGEAFTHLVADRGILLTLFHLFGLGHDGAWGPLARERFLDAYRIVRDEAGLTPAEANEFFMRGMLITVLLALRMPDAQEDPDAMELMAYTFGAKLGHVVEFSHKHLPLIDVRRTT